LIVVGIADTSFVVAFVNERDQAHERCLAVYRRFRTIYLPQTTLAEVAYLLARESGNWAVAFFLLRLPKTKFVLTALDDDHIQRTGFLLRQYVDSRLDFVDATVIAVAESTNIRTILTLDQRDFRLVRPQHTTAFELLP
jgi:predicted nucleic acid-binding protein